MERAALERDGILDVLSRHAVLVQSKLKAPRRIQVGFAQTAAANGHYYSHAVKQGQVHFDSNLEP